MLAQISECSVPQFHHNLPSKQHGDPRLRKQLTPQQIAKEGCSVSSHRFSKYSYVNQHTSEEIHTNADDPVNRNKM